MSLLLLQTSVLGALHDGSHTTYVIQVSEHNGRGIATVRRRYSAYVDLRKYALRHLTSCACGTPCLLQPILRDVFIEMETDTFFVLNTDRLIQHRVASMHYFLQRLHNELAKAPPKLVIRSEAKGCKVTALIKSYIGALPSLYDKYYLQQ
ncbi:unnamed protein product [Aphanomyces euteiches]|uniref:PX domain-containing protein n=1 Tax=Aphanomyces euteiches TaxID=100861 RepID=A0A6G0WTY9_9STRA|nr:hypothetical protein Ae201684_011548 [Aphanomyces euteiches]KAH9097163.1 hypothetical protein Ae201684P_011887 [Aphanomyces euteiches]KAH9107135.1 hypothetical protein AeMF1_017441 [Aphanomyces euteiches]KAH9112361.1 hypothetical protein LEN26_013292 [Aphanomyces euteiches]KAH9143888.1 hypothetical protein AeRB84_012131 [Aphanomyces euteiches]